MGDRIAGIGSITVDGTQLALRANLTVSPSPIEREGLAGQDRVQGFREMPRVPYIEADISVTKDLNVSSLDTQTDVTVVAGFADGRIWVLRNAWYRPPSDVNTHDGLFRARWEGLSCGEIQ